MTLHFTLNNKCLSFLLLLLLARTNITKLKELQLLVVENVYLTFMLRTMQCHISASHYMPFHRKSTIFTLSDKVFRKLFVLNELSLDESYCKFRVNKVRNIKQGGPGKTIPTNMLDNYTARV